MGIKIADGLVLPENAATQVYAFIGRRGSGKTYGAGRFTEQLLDAGHQAVILDPVGVWWGLRLAADGRSPGIDIPVFGGIHGDIPLEATAGRVVAELVAARRTSLVLDVSEFTQGEQGRFVADFATELFAAKKRSRSAVMVVLDEAQDFVPQNPEPGEARMLGALQRMAKLGRNFGIGLALLSQRPQEVSKKVLNLSEVLLCFQLNGTHERKAVTGWVQEKGEGERIDVGLELPSLPIGTAMVWSPQWLRTFGRYRILPKRTFDASATPDQATTDGSAPLAPIDLQQIQAAMAASIESAKASDPTALRAEVERLRRELEQMEGRARTEYIPAIYEEEREKINETLRALQTTGEALADKIRMAVARLPAFPGIARPRPVRRPTTTITAPPTAAAAAARTARAPVPSTTDDDKGGPIGVLTALAGAGGRLPRRHLATLAGYRPSVSTLRNYLGTLKREGLVEVQGEEVVITDLGRERAGRPPAKTAAELLVMWYRSLTPRSAQVLDAMAHERGPWTEQRIRERCTVPPGASTLRNILTPLRVNDLIRKVRGGLEVNPLLRQHP